MMLRITGQDLLQVASTHKKKLLPVSAVLIKRKALHCISLLNSHLTDYSTISYNFTLYPSFWPDSPQHFREAQKKAKTKAKREKENKPFTTPSLKWWPNCCVRSKDGETQANNPATLQSSS